MKKRIVLFAAAIVCITGLCGCGSRQPGGGADVFVMTNPAAAESAVPETEVSQTGNAVLPQEQDTALPYPDAKASQKTQDQAQEETETAGEQCVTLLRVENPGGEYYFAGGEAASNAQTVTLEKVSEKKNEITDVDTWLAENGLVKPGFPYEDEKYRYEVSGDDGYAVYQLRLYDKETGELTANLDFTDYRYANDFALQDSSFVEQRICYARAQDGVLYVATAHNTYSESSPHTAYVTALDLSDFHVIWKTAPLMCNSYSFALVGDALVCGYGFTAEDDFLNIIDRETGKLWEQVRINSMAEYIIWQDETLYVRTYDTDYMFLTAGRDGGGKQ